MPPRAFAISRDSYGCFQLPEPNVIFPLLFWPMFFQGYYLPQPPFPPSPTFPTLACYSRLVSLRVTSRLQHANVGDLGEGGTVVGNNLVKYQKTELENFFLIFLKKENQVSTSNS